MDGPLRLIRTSYSGIRGHSNSGSSNTGRARMTMDSLTTRSPYGRVQQGQNVRKKICITSISTSSDAAARLQSDYLSHHCSIIITASCIFHCSFAAWILVAMVKGFLICWTKELRSDFIDFSFPPPALIITDTESVSWTNYMTNTNQELDVFNDLPGGRFL